jgi:hypothetical protein
MKEYGGLVNESDNPQPSSPRFVDSVEPAQQVVRLSPFRHLVWMRQAFGVAGRFRSEVRIVGLVIAFGLAGGATGGIVAAVSLHMKEQARAPAVSGVGEVDSEAAPEQAASLATPNVNAADSEVGPATAVRPQRKSLRSSKPRARLMAIYDDLDFDLVPQRKKHGKKDEY